MTIGSAWRVGVLGVAVAMSGDLVQGQQPGRRDPFASLVAPASSAPASRPVVKRRPGLAGVAAADVELRGVVASGAVQLALLSAPDGKTYLAKVQDRLHDAVIRRIEADAIVLTLSVSAPGGARDVRKSLRPVADGGRP